MRPRAGSVIWINGSIRAGRGKREQSVQLEEQSCCGRSAGSIRHLINLA
jgi:hypothetical protein